MAEIGLIASVLAVAGAGFTVAKSLFSLANTIGGAGAEVRVFATDTAMFSQTLEHLGEKLRAMHSPSGPVLRTAEDLADVCKRTLEPLREQLESLEPLLERCRNSERVMYQFALRVRWAFKHRSKVLFYRRTLDSLKMTLACLLGSMNLVADESKREVYGLLDFLGHY